MGESSGNSNLKKWLVSLVKKRPGNASSSSIKSIKTVDNSLTDVKRTVDMSRCNLKNSVITLPDKKLTTTECVCLDSNQMSCFPEEISRCTNLRVLSATDNDLVQLPTWIGSLIHLEKLDLSKNNLSQVSESIKCLKRLKSLNLNLNPLETLDPSLIHCNSLTELCINDCCLQYLPATLGRLSNLLTLEVRNNGIQYLPQSIGRLNKLQLLDLGSNRLVDLPASLVHLCNLKFLFCDGNCLKSLPSNFDALKLLEMLDLSSNDLTTLSDLICFLPCLKYLDVSHNQIQCLSEGFGYLKKLETLKLDYNNLVCLPAGFCRMQSLVEVTATNNRLVTLPKTISDLKSLEILILDDNFLKELPNEIGECNRLTILSIRGNSLKTLPDSSWKLIDLTVLDVRCNKLTFLPLCLRQLVNLRALWLSENQTVPKVPLVCDRDLGCAGKKVLTCYLLPQDSSNVNIAQASKSLKSVKRSTTQSKRKITFETSTTKTELRRKPTKNKAESNSSNAETFVKEAKVIKCSDFTQKPGKISSRLLFQLDKMKLLEQKSKMHHPLEPVTFVKNNFADGQHSKASLINRARPPSVIRPYAMVDLKTLQSRLSLLQNSDRLPAEWLFNSASQLDCSEDKSTTVSKVGFSHEYETIFDLTKKSIKPANSNVALQASLTNVDVSTRKLTEKCNHYECTDLNRSF